MGTIFPYLETTYNIKINTVSDYIKLLKKTEIRPIDTFLALAAIREFYDATSFRFFPTYGTPLSSNVSDNVVRIEDEYFRYEYVIEETTKPFLYLNNIEVKSEPKIERKKVQVPDYFQSATDLLVILTNRKNRTAYEDYLYALLFVNNGTLPFNYALPFPPSRNIDKVVFPPLRNVENTEKVIFDDNIIRVFSNGEERDIILLNENIETSPFTFGVVK